MSVFRVEKNKGYTVMSNHHLRNHALSLKAKGLLSQMLSLPEMVVGHDRVTFVFLDTEYRHFCDLLRLRFQI